MRCPRNGVNFKIGITISSAWQIEAWMLAQASSEVMKIRFSALAGISALLVAGACVLGASYLVNAAPPYIQDELEHFKYGSIGAEVDGYPFLVWRELPTLFRSEFANGWQSFGFLQESNRTLPVGVSVRRYGIDRVGFNCATCHTTQVAGLASVIAGAPADQLDLQAYLRFLIRTSKDARFSADAIFAAAESNQRPIGWLDRQVFRFYIIPKIKSQLADYESGSGQWMKSRPDHGPGRADAGNPWRQRFGMRPQDDALTGAVDTPSLWQQRSRKDAWMHWDGNNGSLAERNLSAALAGGASEDSMDHPSIERVAAWSLDLASPRFPQLVSQQLVDQGRPIYGSQCAACHDLKGSNFGKVTSLSLVQTDPDRVNLFSREMVAAFGGVGAGRPWQFKNYRKTVGYANAPLDGIWARAPYLHNGSVPTLQDLLLPPAQRPQKFFKGCQAFDSAKVGRTCLSGFLFDTTLRGNGNGGHEWGTSLDDGQRAALLEFLKTL
jgi:mono/diheme cytochrome c family protein